jgi:UDP-2,3-diacylglucosamine hydrolase
MKYKKLTEKQVITIPEGKKIFFASDFHLGSPDEATSLVREKKIIRWLTEIAPHAAMIFLVGDIFDFWFEYKKAIPKGFIRFQGKIAELADAGIPIIFFTGNHDMWMFDYFTEELGIPLYRQPQQFLMNNTKFLIGHGDGLGPGDKSFKILKKIFKSRFCQWLFARIHPNLGIGIAHYWSRSTRKHKLSDTSHQKKDAFQGEDEWIYQYCKETESQESHQLYIFGHRHLPLDMKVGEKGRYINLGEWFTQYTFAEFDGKELKMRTYEN